MKSDFNTLSFSEKERICESVFACNGPYWHLYTDGTRMQNIFCSEDDFRIGMWILAASLHMHKNVKALTFELMNNHVHLILSGMKMDCIRVFDDFASRLKHVFARKGRVIDWRYFEMNVISIDDIQMLRNEIIYVNRNAYVANPMYTPNSYPWGGGCFYFNCWVKYLNPTPLGKLKVNMQRELLHTRDVSLFSELLEIDSIPFAPSFCDIELGESMFRDARSYFGLLTRNAEAFSQIASRLKDMVFLTDDELYSVLCSFINKEYSVKTSAQLTGQQKIDTARYLRFNCNATNQQLRRLLRMEMSILEELFP